MYPFLLIVCLALLSQPCIAAPAAMATWAYALRWGPYLALATLVIVSAFCKDKPDDR